MLRFMMFGALLLAIASAVTLYAVNYTSRRIAVEVATQKNHKEKLINRISLLKAERAYLSRPDRIGPLAEKMGMRPLAASQVDVRAPSPSPGPSPGPSLGPSPGLPRARGQP